MTQMMMRSDNAAFYVLGTKVDLPSQATEEAVDPEVFPGPTSSFSY